MGRDRTKIANPEVWQYLSLRGKTQVPSKIQDKILLSLTNIKTKVTPFKAEWEHPHCKPFLLQDHSHQDNLSYNLVSSTGQPPAAKGTTRQHLRHVWSSGPQSRKITGCPTGFTTSISSGMSTQFSRSHFLLCLASASHSCFCASFLVEA